MPQPEVSPTSYEFQIFADYHQFYLQDEDAEIDDTDFWDAEAVANMLAVGQGIIGIGTARNTDVPVRLTVLQGAPEESDTPWDQVAEASMEVPSGVLVLTGPSDYLPDAARISVEPGTYRVRIYYGGLDRLSVDGLEGEDHDALASWPQPYQTPALLKKRINNPLS